MLSIVIPAYNEKERLAESLQKIKKSYPKAEILVVDDGSTDSTSQIAKKEKVKLVRYVKNRGKGYAVNMGLKKATGDHILITDADLSAPIDQCSNLIRYCKKDPTDARAKKYDIVIGSRALKKSLIPQKQPFMRQVVGKVFRIITRLVTGLHFKDTQCGFKLFTKDAAKQLAKMQKETGFAFDVELLYLAKKKHFKVYECPIEWSNDTRSKVHALRDGSRMFIALLRIRLRKY